MRSPNVECNKDCSDLPLGLQKALKNGVLCSAAEIIHPRNLSYVFSKLRPTSANYGREGILKLSYNLR